ncbi:structural maintenance of chromosomes protein 5-like [Diaphorina citri]|uniref:Structural maintenance of chromosomes protein 5-like n=1 Tax=Diaphorina citri TaxID=121845 RepID=A0A3Q0J9Q4_DIACI|nr:structural maintenance of chromosomes protein 5-like [Diaphorina citri]
MYVLNKCKEQCARVRGEIELIEDQLKNLGDEEGDIKKEIDSKKMLLSVASNDIVCCNETEVSAQINEYQSILKREFEKANKVKSSKNRIEFRLEALQTELSNAERRLQKIQNVRYQREQQLSSISEDAMKATHWLRENRHLFAGEIYEPMLLEINIKRPEFTRQIETLLSRDDLLAFTCERAEDAGILLRELREVRKWRVNIVTMPDENKRRSIRPSPYPIAELRSELFELSDKETHIHIHMKLLSSL